MQSDADAEVEQWARVVTAWFADEGVVDPEDFPAGTQLALVAALASLYADTGLVTRTGPLPLHECCPNAQHCWSGHTEMTPSDAGGRSGISLPWIGPSYRRGGVVVVGMNLHDAGGLLAEYAITCRSGGDDSVLGRLSEGRERINGSPFGYRSTRSAAAVIDWIERRPVNDRSAAGELPDYLERTARLQQVKCSPDDGDRSSPTDAMHRRCPPLLLARELTILRPSAILTFGDEVRQEMERLPGYRVISGTDWLSWGQLDIGGALSEVFSLYHPAAPHSYWDNGQADLITELRSRTEP